MNLGPSGGPSSGPSATFHALIRCPIRTSDERLSGIAGAKEKVDIDEGSVI